MCHEIADLQFLDLAYEPVACRNSHGAIIPRAREPVEEEIAGATGIRPAAYFLGCS
jgi:hypothetical protein